MELLSKVILVSDFVRFRKPEDLYQPSFRTVLCGTHPIRIQMDADPEVMCNEYYRMSAAAAVNDGL